MRGAALLAALWTAAPGALADQCAQDYSCTSALTRCEGSSYDSGCRQQYDSCVSSCRGSGGASPDAPAAPLQFGAIAYSPSSRAHGYSYNFGDRGSAESAALGYCRQSAGAAADCAIQVWFQSCGALAGAPDGSFGTGWGATPAQAQGHALAACQGHSTACRLTGTVCNGPD